MDDVINYPWFHLPFVVAIWASIVLGFVAWLRS